MCVRALGLWWLHGKKYQCLFRLAFGQEWGVSKRTVSGLCENKANAGTFQENVKMATGGRLEAEGGVRLGFHFHSQ